jgi:hypothetical protein
VSDPFRDGMEAALRRSETLAEENELLREEIESIRKQATAIRDGAKHTSPETHVLADQALGVLDQLEALSKRPDKVRVELQGLLTGELRPLDAVSQPLEPAREYGGALELPGVKIAPKSEPKLVPPNVPRGGYTGTFVFAIAAIAFVVGFAIAHC